mgnify:CR=1 FL=1
MGNSISQRRMTVDIQTFKILLDEAPDPNMTGLLSFIF